MTDPSEKKTVLVVDDDDSVLRVTMRALQSFGFTTIGAKDGFEAVSAFREQHQALDCVILDMSMPGMSGKQTLQSLREIDPDVPVLLASGHSVDEMREMYGETGFAGYLQKPFQIATLNDAVHSVINGRQKS